MARKSPAAHASARKGMGFAAAVESARASGARNPAAAIASAAQHASPAAKRRNPNLSKVSGVGRKGHRGAGQEG
jgi:hypothetical protein